LTWRSLPEERGRGRQKGRRWKEKRLGKSREEREGYWPPKAWAGSAVLEMWLPPLLAGYMPASRGGEGEDKMEERRKREISEEEGRRGKRN